MTDGRSGDMATRELTIGRLAYRLCLAAFIAPFAVFVLLILPRFMTLKAGAYVSWGLKGAALIVLFAALLVIGRLSPLRRSKLWGATICIIGFEIANHVGVIAIRLGSPAPAGAFAFMGWLAILGRLVHVAVVILVSAVAWRVNAMFGDALVSRGALLAVAVPLTLAAVFAAVIETLLRFGLIGVPFIIESVGPIVFIVAHLALGAGVVLLTIGWRKARRRLQRGLCRDCGYELRGLETERCPECGRPTAADERRLAWDLS
ncbi:MAG: hypothetical protein ACYTF9_07710 [Planctomycetota bacterium]